MNVDNKIREISLFKTLKDKEDFLLKLQNLFVKKKFQQKIHTSLLKKEILRIPCIFSVKEPLT